MGQVIIAVFDGDHVPLIDACSDDRLDGSLRWSLMQALARLTFDGKIARATTLEFMDRFEHEPLATPGDIVWEGWHDVIVLLGLEEMRQRLHATWADGRNQSDPRDHEEIERELSIACALAPGDPALFDKHRIAALSDPAGALSWMAPRESSRDRAADDPDSGDPGSVVALRDFEVWWLAGFLRSDKVPPGAMTFEQVDGFFCSLIAGPLGTQPAAAMAALWSEDDVADVEPTYDSLVQVQYVESLLRRHWTSISQRLEQGYLHDPIFTEGRGSEQGRHWAGGFLRGVAARTNEWSLRFSEPNIGMFVEAMLSLGMDPTIARTKGFTSQLRDQLLKVLPLRLVALHHIWRGRPDPFPPTGRATPSRKIGRNEPCPCGSGKKYKRCCGSA